jgi:hypothetical protein
MHDPEDIDRRTLLGSSLAFAALALSGCGGSGESGGACHRSGGTAGTGGTDACTFTMTGNHMHGLQVPPADVSIGKDASYVLEDCGTGHTHRLEITAYDFGYLKAGATRMIDSTTTNSHLHNVSITCPVT